MNEERVAVNSAVPTMYVVEGIPTGTETEMTVYAALSKRKLYAKRLEELKKTSSSRETLYVGVRNASTQSINGKTIEEYENTLKANYDRNVAILTNYYNLTAAITQSNAVTPITIGGMTMTVAEAIVRYTHLNEEIAMINAIMSEVAKAESKVSIANTDYLSDERIEAYVKDTMASLPESVTKDMSETTSNEIREKFRQEYIDRNTTILIDPYKHAGSITERRDKIEAFVNEINEKLNVCNMTTVIKVNLVN